MLYRPRKPTRSAATPTPPCWDNALKFHPPVIHRVERDGKAIRIQASDNVMVTSVQVMILDEKGKVVEKGEGIRGKGDLWEYVQAVDSKVIVEARDLAGNVAKEELVS